MDKRRLYSDIELDGILGGIGFKHISVLSHEPLTKGAEIEFIQFDNPESDVRKERIIFLESFRYLHPTHGVCTRGFEYTRGRRQNGEEGILGSTHKFFGYRLIKNPLMEQISSRLNRDNSGP